MSIPTGLRSRIQGALYGLAIGDGMGASVEGWPSARVVERFGSHDFRTFLPHTHGQPPFPGKGEGRITDDTLMTEALMRAYGRKRGHMDAYDYRDFLLPEYAEVEVWVPERDRLMVLLDRLNPGERYTVLRLTRHLAYPRHAGIGNDIHCGIAMYMMPVGAVNAGDPVRACHEAAALAMVQTDSYGVEGAALLASCYARAFALQASIASVCAHAAELARDGTRRAVERVLAAVSLSDPIEGFIRRVRAAFVPFCPGETPGQDPAGDPTLTNRNQPSRTLAIEEPPVALAALLYGDGDFHKTLRAAVCYGRDSDSIAGMACGLYGGIHGVEALPARLRTDSDAANKRCFADLAARFADTVSAIHEDDRSVLDRRPSLAGGAARMEQRAGNAEREGNP